MQAAADLGGARSRRPLSRPAEIASLSVVFGIQAEISGPRRSTAEALGVVEIDVDERVLGHVAFDLEDIDAAFEELETRYLVGEAAAHAHTWSVIARGNAAANRNENCR